MRRWAVALMAGLFVGAVALAACGGDGDGDDGDKTATGTGTSKTSAATSKAGTPGKTGTATSGTPGADGTSASGTPEAGGTAGATGGTPGAEGTPRPVETIEGSGNTPVASDVPVTPNASERNTLGEDSELTEDITGGNLDAEPEVLNDLPEPPAGATIDPSTIAATNSGISGMQAILDLNASEPGIQTTRTIKVGDVIRVGLVLTGIPSYDGGIGNGGIAAFNAQIAYDYAKIVAPTIINGSSLSRNPDLNEGSLGSGPGGWNCLLPAPQGDADDPGSFTGDGDPETGQAMISCFADGVTNYSSGEIVLATVQFQAVASGDVDLSFYPGDTDFFDANATQIGDCDDSADVAPISCNSATLTVE